ncbi:unnamed protein product, partial [Laminaria digitata]
SAPINSSTFPNGTVLMLRPAKICALRAAYWSSILVLMASCKVPSSGSTGPTHLTFANNNLNSPLYTEKGVPCSTMKFCNVCITAAGNALLKPLHNILRIKSKASCPLAPASN